MTFLARVGSGHQRPLALVLQELDQQLVALGHHALLVERRELFVDARHQQGGELGSELRRTEIVHPDLRGRAEMLEGVSQAALPAGEVLVDQRPQQRSAQSRSVADRGVDAHLARASFVTPQSMADMLRALEHRVFIRRAMNPANRREVLVHLTPEGRSLLAAHAVRAEAIESRLTAGLDHQARADFRAALTVAWANLSDWSIEELE